MNEKDSNDEKKQTTAKPNNNTTNTAFIPREIEKIEPYLSGNKNQSKDKKKNNGWPNRWQTIFTGLIFIVTTAYTIFAYLQWDTMSKQLDEMKSSSTTSDQSMKNTLAEMRKQSNVMQIAADANKNAVKMAERNINATQEQFRLDQRAWVGIIDFNPPPFTDGHRNVYIKEGEGAAFDVMIANTGKTPARKIKSRQRIESLRASIQFTPHYLIFSKGAAVIQPGMKMKLSLSPTQQATKEHIIALQEGQIVLYIYGEITYEDVFGKEHRTTFCSFLEKDLSRINHCNTYNNAN